MFPVNQLTGMNLALAATRKPSNQINSSNSSKSNDTGIMNPSTKRPPCVDGANGSAILSDINTKISLLG